MASGAPAWLSLHTQASHFLPAYLILLTPHTALLGDRSSSRQPSPRDTAPPPLRELEALNPTARFKWVPSSLLADEPGCHGKSEKGTQEGAPPRGGPGLPVGWTEQVHRGGRPSAGMPPASSPSPQMHAAQRAGPGGYQVPPGVPPSQQRDCSICARPGTRHHVGTFFPQEAICRGSG